MKKKPAKVQEPRAAYPAKKPAKAVVKPSDSVRLTPDEAAFRKVADKIFSERRDLLRKLAQ